MAGIGRTKVSLRFFGDDLDPDALTASLGAPPTLSDRKGDVRVGRTGRQWTARTGRWLRQAVPRVPGDLDAQIVELLSPLSPDFAVWRDLVARFRGDLYCGLFMDEENEGLTLEPETVTMIGARALAVHFDIYALFEEEDVDQNSSREAAGHHTAVNEKE